MKRKQGDMWSSYNQADLFLVTTNSTLRNDGAHFWQSGAVEYFSSKPVVKVIFLRNNSTWNFIAIFDEADNTDGDAFFCPHGEMIQRCIIYGIPLEEE